MTSRIWNIVTGVYPPQSGGVADYTRIVAKGLAARGEDVHVWTGPTDDPGCGDAGVAVHRLPDQFGPIGLARLNAGIARARDSRILIQYVPHAFGWRAMNIPFCAWVAAQGRAELAVTFHEVAFPVFRGQSLRRNALGAVNRVMARLVVRAAKTIFVTASAWEKLLHGKVGRPRRIVWTPVPSNIRRIDDERAVASVRRRYANQGSFLVSHFAWAETPWISGVMSAMIGDLLRARDDLTFMLMGRGSGDMYRAVVKDDSSIRRRVAATGELTPRDLSCHLSACDLVVQPYPDGISGRRTTTMAALAHGLPVLSTEGCHTESIWRESGAVSLVPDANACELADRASRLLDSAAERRRVGAAGLKLYERAFDLRHTLDALCQ
ncbi:MAG TPA: glycosyltransferase family 4 protein [Candidatus Binataceae bacterium]|nr:glycosyltransferase family 4 protein [Candidatus Binataceae bacterium]